MIDVACAVIKKKNKYLVAQKMDIIHLGKWEFPGGKAKKNELLFDSIKREIKEELNIAIIPQSEIIRYTYKNFNLIFILCFLDNYEDKITLNEHEDFKWISIDEFETFDFVEGDLKFLEFIQANQNNY